MRTRRHGVTQPCSIMCRCHACIGIAGRRPYTKRQMIRLLLLYDKIIAGYAGLPLGACIEKRPRKMAGPWQWSLLGWQNRGKRAETVGPRIRTARGQLRRARGLPGRLAVAGNRQAFGADVRRLGDQVGQQLCRSRRSWSSPGAVAGVQRQIGKAGAATIGVPSGVIGRRPVQNPLPGYCRHPGNRSPTTISSVARRSGFSDRSKPASSAMPPTRMRSSKAG